ncbi:hypothetical protein Tcan_10694 [Toxocara canis]|uniref:Large ribosomal subunit protein bL36m n=1 Tax=Toxocara canis TaxID=6265 RepID=A0A0B2VHW1_TOXCA|nr:hypothetical protein Tcan_10694 [Toxocara canis]
MRWHQRENENTPSATFVITITRSLEEVITTEHLIWAKKTARKSADMGLQMSSNVLREVIRGGMSALQCTCRGLLGVRLPLTESSAAFKVKGMLKLRCRHCYFVRVDGRLEVKCPVHPRHNAKEPFNVKLLW